MRKERDLRHELRTRVDARLDALINKFYREVPFAQHQLNSPELHLEYYKRHNIETILRLRMKRTIDALTIHYFTKHDPVRAKAWARYTDDEMLHDQLFAKDLEKVGVPTEAIYAQEPLFSTKILQGYFYYGLEHEGRPLASLVSSYVIEYFTTKTQGAWLENLEKRLGADKIRGQRAHLNHDMDEDHTDFVWEVIASFMESEADEKKLFEHLDNVYRLFCAYFTELYQTVVERHTEPAVYSVLAAPVEVTTGC
jgi:pyrroloquinoline quinone (PQQ) biosynthesis protein C